ncbi:MAG TPA: ATP-dependent 6-phosphofructokinase [Thermoanaerobaculia bacterium]|nr:ATP-dependent 6-phosphofructokinase [Thermoanaerobaculia bacterium]
MKPRILLVENVAETRETTARLLEGEGFEVFGAENDEEARAIMARQLIHLALIDVRLVDDDDRNDTTGLELCRHIDGDIPRIIVTAHPNWEIVRTLAESLVEKGTKPEALLSEIRTVLTRFYDVIPRRRLAILTSGGDAPGMNAAIWSALRTALSEQIEMFAIYDGYRGLLNDDVRKLRWSSVADTLTTGGTMLGTARSQEFKDEPEKRKIGARNLIKRHIDGLIVIGGDGSMQGAQALAAAIKDEGAKLDTVALPGTIDNDLAGTDMSIGAASAVAAAMHEINNMVAPARALRRIFVCEIMGKYSGFLTLELGLCVGADAVLLPEELVVIKSGRAKNKDWQQHVDYDKTRRKVLDEIKVIAHRLEQTFSSGKRHAFVLVSEGIRLLATEDKHEYVNLDEITRALRGHVNDWTITSKAEVRSQTIGYPMRGAPPSRSDIHLGTTLGEAAVRALVKGDSNVMLGWSEKGGKIDGMKFDEVVSRSNRAPEVKFADRKDWQKTVKLQRALVKPLPKLT